MKKPKTKPAKAGTAKTHADRLTQAGTKVWRVYDTVLADPADLTLIRDPAHPLFDPRVNDPVDPSSPRYLEILAAGKPHTPIKCRENGIGRDGKPILQVVDGRDRVQILQHINEHHPLESGPRKLKVDLVRGNDGAMVLLSLSANSTKAETPYSMAVKIGKADACGQAHEEIARACGWVSTLPVRKHLALLNLAPEVQAAFHGPSALPLSAVETFAKVPRENQVAALAAVRSNGVKKAREVEAAVKAAQDGAEYAPPPKVRVWGAQKVLRLADAIGQIAVPPGHTGLHTEAELAVARAVLRHITGNEGALNAYPLLQAAVAKATA